jgi:hypothetical protein
MSKIKKIKKLRVNSFVFDVSYADKGAGGRFSFSERKLELGIKGADDEQALMILTHELMEMCIIEMNCRLNRPDVDSDYLFVMDHRQFETACNMFSGLLAQFLDG